jgi:tripartite-type tricarboxylate transporter receptor subunit TctC
VDATARQLADALTPRLKTSIVIDNQGGAAGALAAQRVATSPADGYTLLLGSSNELAATGVLNRAQKYDPAKDFSPVGLVSSAPVLLVAGPKAGFKTLAEMIDAVKRNPGKYSYGSSGVGSTLHFAGELLKQRAGLFMTHIPYRGVAPLTNDLAGGAIELAMLSVPGAMPFLQSGRLTALGVTGSQRLKALPQVPALAEHALLKGYEMSGWFALVGPKGLPPEVSGRLQAVLHEALADAQLRQRMEDSGSYPAGPRDDLAKLMRDDIARFAKLADYAHMRE